MKAAVIVFPGSNCDRDLAVALRAAGIDVAMVWHKDTILPAGVDLVALPGGFSYGDYLRCGAIAAQSAISEAVREHAARGGYVLGICNGFQILTELELLPGALLRNRGLTYICRTEPLVVGNAATPFTALYDAGETVSIPIAHHDGSYFADPATLDEIEGEGRVAFRYAKNPNGSVRDIAGLVSANGRVLGMMPHPERAAEPALGLIDGRRLFAGISEARAIA